MDMKSNTPPTPPSTPVNKFTLLPTVPRLKREKSCNEEKDRKRTRIIPRKLFESDSTSTV